MCQHKSFLLDVSYFKEVDVTTCEYLCTGDCLGSVTKLIDHSNGKTLFDGDKSIYDQYIGVQDTIRQIQQLDL